MIYFTISSSIALVVVQKLDNSWGVFYACILWVSSLLFVFVNIIDLAVERKLSRGLKNSIKNLQLYTFALFLLYLLLGSLVDGWVILILYLLTIVYIKLGKNMPLSNKFMFEEFDGPIRARGLLVNEFTIFLQLYPLMDFNTIKDELFKLGDEILILRSTFGESAYLKVSSKHILRKRGKEIFLKKIGRKVSEADLIKLCLLRVVDAKEVSNILNFKYHIKGKKSTRDFPLVSDVIILKSKRNLNTLPYQGGHGSIKIFHIGKNGEEVSVKLGFDDFKVLNDLRFAFCKSLAVLKKTNINGQVSIKVTVYEEGDNLTLSILSSPKVTLSKEQLLIQCAIYSIDPSTFSYTKKPASELCLQKG